jgi:hypothetical protein
VNAEDSELMRLLEIEMLTRGEVADRGERDQDQDYL